MSRLYKRLHFRVSGIAGSNIHAQYFLAMVVSFAVVQIDKMAPTNQMYLFQQGANTLAINRIQE